MKSSAVVFEKKKQHAGQHYAQCKQSTLYTRLLHFIYFLNLSNNTTECLDIEFSAWIITYSHTYIYVQPGATVISDTAVQLSYTHTYIHWYKYIIAIVRSYNFDDIFARLAPAWAHIVDVPRVYHRVTKIQNIHTGYIIENI